MTAVIVTVIVTVIVAVIVTVIVTAIVIVVKATPLSDLTVIEIVERIQMSANCSQTISLVLTIQRDCLSSIV